MPLEPPTWATPQDVEEHGAYFLACFQNRAHLDHALATGDIRRPASIKRTAARAADPLKVARETLRHRVEYARRSIKDAERQIAQATPLLGTGWGYRAEATIAAQRARIVERQAVLKKTELDLALFDALHTKDR